MNYNEFENCGVKRSLDLLSGKWKPLILHHLFQEKEIRFIELWRKMPRVSKKVLLEQLKQLEENNIIERIEFNDFPPKVFYKIHEEAKELGNLLKTLDDFGNKHIN
ncbi:winged helix-turn-helix transcriptional regulator [Algibacter pacificus]|uniref:winged helix-turn-helix transcriptional regulator n=1 Tax=Algibacter pacificus TaxID=2599389 RepID=UPI0011C71343|nr:helix-turn-helix domain-containing protein [Algibacter pacificus]